MRTARRSAEGPVASYNRRISGDLGTQLIAAIGAQDRAALAACFSDDVRFRALIPPGLRERESAGDAAALIAGWFADSTVLELVDADAEQVGDRLHVSYRVEGIEDGEPYVVEQQLYCTLADGRIARADLLCSGFRPR